MKYLRLSVFGTVVALLSAGMAHASPCAAGSGCASDILKITDANGNVINDINGNPAFIVIPEGTGGTPEVSSASFDFALFTGPETTVTLTEGSPTGFTEASDTVLKLPINTPTGPITRIQFGSDSGLFDNCDVLPCVGETGQLQDVTDLLFPAGVLPPDAAPPFHVFVQSSVSAVPEPSGALVNGAGLVLVAATRRRIVASQVRGPASIEKNVATP